MNSNERKWNTHVQAWLESRLSQKRYCDEHNLALSTFQWWRKRLRDAAGTGPNLVEVPRSVEPSGNTESGIEIRTRGITLRVTSDIEPDYIARIVKALEAR